MRPGRTCKHVDFGPAGNNSLLKIDRGGQPNSKHNKRRGEVPDPQGKWIRSYPNCSTRYQVNVVDFVNCEQALGTINQSLQST